MAHGTPRKSTGKHYSKSENKRRSRMSNKRDMEKLLMRLSKKKNASKFKYRK